MDSSNNSFKNIFINILIPVLILNKGTKFLGLSPALAVVIALAFPLFYGLYSLIKEKKINYISLLGLINILFSGILTILALGGIWFAIKEAAFPLLIGIFVFVSSRSAKPFFETLFLNPAVFNIDTLFLNLDSEEKKARFNKLVVSSTQFLSLSFLLSAALNFGLSLYIFTPLDQNLPIEQRQDLLNQQLSQMTAYSMLVILVPTLIFVGLIMYNAFKKISQITGLKIDDLLVKEPTPNHPKTP